ncbi:hypothetical protein ABZT51_42370 [Streptomyces sp. NPDC005373]|uniref:hypothetical protein n=1 Tax=Streptomyces sp. NPDC005373 TaxID=3156879 RepID=UPI0033A0D75E
MTKLLIVAGPNGDIRAAAKINPRNTYSVIEIEAKTHQGESLHEVDLPEDLKSENLQELANYQLTQGNRLQLVKRTG